MANFRSPAAVLLDIDGTLLESNDAHAISWVQTFERHGRSVPFARVRPLIGKGGDKILAELLGIGADEPLGRRLSEDRRRIFRERHLPRLRPTPGARALLERMRAERLALVVATSATGEELQALLRQAGVDDLITGSASSSDAERSKPDPDIVAAALAKSGVGAGQALMLGDTPYDIAAARAVGVATIALRCGGWSDAALADAIAIYDDPAALLDAWQRSPLRRRLEARVAETATSSASR